MANITKSQIKSRKQELYDRIQKLFDGKLTDIRDDLEILKEEVEEELNDIEPYEGRNELTAQQQERQDWLDSASTSLDSALGELNEALEYLEYAQGYLEEIE